MNNPYENNEVKQFNYKLGHIGERIVSDEINSFDGYSTVKTEFNEIYRDIFGNRYVVFNANFLGDNDKPYVALARVGKKGEAIITDLVTVPLEDFLNPTLKREYLQKNS